MKKKKIYTAGPECFYKGGPDILNAVRRKAESLGSEISFQYGEFSIEINNN